MPPALIAVDLQYDFFDTAGRPDAGRLAKALCLPSVRQLVEHARRNGWKIVHVVTEHEGASTLPPHLRRRGAQPYCVARSPGGGIIAGLKADGDAVISKQAFDGFSNPQLAAALEGFDELIICGVATDCCVLFTAHSAANLHQKQVYLPYQALAASTLGAYVFGLEAAAKSIGAVIDARDLLQLPGASPNLAGMASIEAKAMEPVESWFKEQLERLKRLQDKTPSSESSIEAILNRLERSLASGEPPS